MVPIEVAADQKEKLLDDMCEKVWAEVARLCRDAATIKSEMAQRAEMIASLVAFRAEISTMFGLEG